MAVTVSGKNYTQFVPCDATTGEGVSWTGFDTQDTSIYKEGSASICGTFKTSGANDGYATLSTGYWDLSGTKHVRLWFLSTQGSLLNTEASNGIQVIIGDGSNTAYYTVGGRDNYPGGWWNIVLDVSQSATSGTKPTDMSQCTVIGVRTNITGTGKNVDNVWIDNLCVCDGLTVYGDDSGGYFDFEDIYSADNTPATGGWGVIRKIGGVYYLTGSIEYGDSSGTNGCKFQAKSQVVIFEDRPVNADLYAFDVVDNGTGTTEFLLGDKSGTAGIQGCVIRVESSSQTAKFDIDGKTDTDVDNFKLYGSTFYGADAISFPAAGANVEILSCSFELCAQIDPNSASTTKCFFINTSDADAAILWNASIALTYCNFIANTTGAAIEMPSAAGSPYTYTGLYFSGNTYDVYNSSGSAITINKAGTPASDPTTYEGSTVTYVGSVDIVITVKDEGGNLLDNVQTAVYKTSDRTQLMNEDTVSGVASDSYSGSTPVEVEVRCRKASGGATKYINYSSVQNLTSSGLYMTVTLREDTLNAATT